MNGLDGKGSAETAGSVETAGSASNELNGLYSEVGACADGAILNTRDFVRGTADSTCADATGAADATDATGADTTGTSGPATLNTRGLTGASTGSSTTDSLTLALGSVVGGNPDNSSKNSGCSFCSVIQSNRIKLNHADEFSGTIY